MLRKRNCSMYITLANTKFDNYKIYVNSKESSNILFYNELQWNYIKYNKWPICTQMDFLWKNKP